MREQAKRQTELDVLRLLAILAVIVMHAGGNSQISESLHPNHHSMFVAAIVWCVPVFFMISGRFFLDPGRNVTTESILKKYIPRIILAYLIWTAVYVAYYVWAGTYDGLNVYGIINQFIEGPYHFWYLFTLVGLYIVTPILRKVTTDKSMTAYFLVVFFAVNLVFEYLVYIPKVGNIISLFTNKVGIGIIGYVGYFMLGYYLYSIKDTIRLKTEICLYIAGVCLWILTIILEGQVSPELQDADFVKQYMKPNVILYSSSIYLFFIKRISKITFSERTQRVFAKLTELSFGVYILHALVNEFISYIPLPQPIQHPYIWLLALTIVIYLISLSLTYLIRKIPVIGKKIT